MNLQKLHGIRIYFRLLFLLIFGGILVSCDDSFNDDMEKPRIETISPLSCDTLFKGKPYIVKSLFSDNIGLSSYKIEIHNNFNHHNHASELEVCSLGDAKEPNNPFSFAQVVPIPENPKEFTSDIQINIPKEVENGDYHLIISVVDLAGWQSFLCVSIKIEA